MSARGLLDTIDVERIESADKYRRFFENAVEGIFQTTAEGQYLAANPALARIYGYESVAAMQAGIRDIAAELYVNPRRRDDFVRLMTADDVITDFESQVRRRDGSVIWISENARAYRDAAGRLLYYEGTVEDVTHRKQAEELFREKEAAEAANRAKSQFLAAMSHEIRTPLNGVAGMLELIAGTELTGQQQRYVALAKSSADVLLSLINHVLDLSKIESGKLELESIAFDLPELLESVPDMFAHRALSKGLALNCQMLGGVPRRVLGDPDRLRQVFVNLMGNAVKFTSQGSVTLRAACEAANGEPAWVRFEIVDTGIGIPPERIGRMFQAFSQADVSTTRKYGGTGLGLAISKQLVELMGGEIGVSSRPGEGSTFWFRVPLAVVEATSTMDERRTQLEGTRVLVVVNEDMHPDMLDAQMTRCGVEVVRAPCAYDALDYLRTAASLGKPFQIVIVERSLPDVDGLKLASTIKTDIAIRDAKLVMLTSLDGDLPAETLERLELSCLHKPIRQSSLFDLLVNLTHECGEEAEGAESTCCRESLETATGADRDVRGLCVLVADDNEINQLVAVEILRSAGYSPSVANDGREAVAMARTGKFHIVLMDCEMPAMDGLAAAGMIRSLEAEGQSFTPGGGRMPIIALTAQAVQGDRERCLAAGMSEYVTKPVNRKELLRTMREQLEAGELPAPEDKTVPRPVPASEESEAVLDIRQLSERCSGDRVFMQSILRKFVTKARDSVERLSKSADEGESVELARWAHDLKGAARNVAACRLGSAVAELEVAARESQSADYQQLTRRIAAELASCEEAVEFLLNESRVACTPAGVIFDEDISCRR